MTDNNTRFFVKYNDSNRKLKHNLNNIKKYAQKLKEYTDDVKEEALKTSSTFFRNQLITVGDLNRIDETLEFNESQLIELIDLLIEIIDKEDKAIHENLGKLRPGNEEISTRLEELLISYNQDKQRKRTEFSELLGIVMQVAHDIIGVEEETEEKLVEKYKNNYDALIGILENKNNADIFEYFKTIILFLKKAKAGGKINLILDHLSAGSNSKTFLSNYKRYNPNERIVNEFERFEVNDKNYDELDEGKQDKIAKFMIRILQSLLENISYENNENYDENKLKTLITVKDNVGDLEKNYYSLLKQLDNEKLSSETYLGDYSYEDLEINLGGNIKWISFAKLKEDYIKKKKKDEIEKAIHEISKLINSDSKKNPYKEFKEHNTNVKNLLKSGGNSNSSGDDEDFKDGEQFTSGDIGEFIKEAKKKILGDKGIEGIEQIINSDYSFENGSLTPAAEQTILGYKSYIIKRLKSIGKNLDKYAETKTNIDINDIKEDIKRIINRFNDIGNKSKIENLIGYIKYVLNRI